MAERPIIFSGPMVQAILDGRKTVTRRLVKPEPVWHAEIPGRKAGGWYAKGRQKNVELQAWADPNDFAAQLLNHIQCPYGMAGDRLWVKEMLKRGKMPNLLLGGDTNADAAFYAADGAPVLVTSAQFDAAWTWQRAVLPSIHMPRWASRLTLEVVSVRVERLHDITEEDAKREGVELLRHRMSDGIPLYGVRGTARVNFESARDAFRHLWASINGAECWDTNPWVWRLELRRVERKP